MKTTKAKTRDAQNTGDGQHSDANWFPVCVYRSQCPGFDSRWEHISSDPAPLALPAITVTLSDMTVIVYLLLVLSSYTVSSTVCLPVCRTAWNLNLAHRLTIGGISLLT